jgi:hypothetical protein
MPYISKEQRETWDAQFSTNAVANATKGEFNYLVTKLLLAWLGRSPRYEDYNAAIGVLECIKLELYRRAVAPYEDKKCEENGDVY